MKKKNIFRGGYYKGGGGGGGLTRSFFSTVVHYMFNTCSLFMTDGLLSPLVEQDLQIQPLQITMVEIY